MAKRHPRMNDTKCVMNDTPGTNAITSILKKKTIVEDCLHHLLRSRGVLQPMTAKRKLDAPTGSRGEANHERVAHTNGMSSAHALYLIPLRKSAHSEKQFTARWKILM